MSFSKLLLIGFAYLRQLKMMVQKDPKKSHSCPHTCWLRVCQFSLLFLQSDVGGLVGSVQFNMLEKRGF